MGLHPAALGDRGVALFARNRLQRSDFRADLLAQLLGVGIEIDVDRTHPGGRGDVDHLLRVVGGPPEARGEHDRAAVVHVGVVLPGEADATVHLDAVLGAVLSGDGRERGGDGGGELVGGVIATVRGLVDGPRRVPHRGGGALGLGDHSGALVLDGLELPDRAAELFADLGVLRGGVGGPAGDTDALGGQQRRHHGAGHRAAEVRQHAVVGDLDGVGADVCQRAQRVDALDGFDLDLVGVEDDPFLAAIDGYGQHQQRRLRGGGHGADLTPDDEAATLTGGRQPGVDGVGGDRLPGGEPLEQLVPRVVGGDQCARDRRRHERPGNRAVTELREHDGEFEDAEALAADVLGEVQPLQALLGGGLPVGRRVGDGRLEGLVQHLRRCDALDQVSDGVGQVVVLGKDRDGHALVSLNQPVGWDREYRDGHRPPSGHLVYQVHQVPPVVKTTAVVDALGEISTHGVDRVPGDVRGQHDVLERQQRIVGRHGFDGEDVQTRRGESPVPERIDQCLLVDDRTARGVDEHRVALHQGQRFGVEQGRRLLRQRQMQRHDVALGEQLGQRTPARGAVVPGAGVHDRAAHGEHDPLDLLGDVAIADQADRAAADVADRLAERGIRRPAAAAPGGGSRAGSLRNAASISSTVPSATDGAFAPGMLATAMPNRVAASTSMVLTPAPSLCTNRHRVARRRSSADSGRRTCQMTSTSGSSRCKVSSSSSPQ